MLLIFDFSSNISSEISINQMEIMLKSYDILEIAQCWKQEIEMENLRYLSKN